MTEEEKADYRGAGLVAFWARKEEIKEMIDAKHTKRNVYRRYGAAMNISYEQFARYVNKYIKDIQHGDNDRAADKGKDIKKATPIRARTPDQPAFVSSDTPRDKDSLIGGKK